MTFRTPHHTRLLAVAGLLFAGVLALLYAISDPREAVSVLFVVPVALCALAGGARGGLAGAVGATVLVAVWASTDHVYIGVVGVLTRLVAFFVIGGLVGRFEDLARDYERARMDEHYAHELHDQVVQSLVVAAYALEGPEVSPAAREAVQTALAGAKDIISDRLGEIRPGDLRLDGGAPSEAPPRERRGL